MEGHKRKEANRGSTLLIVMVAISFIAILATVALSMSAANLQMKSIENKAKKNFYSAESALDELKAGLETELAAITEEVYTETMIHYASETAGQRNKLFQENFLKMYLKKYAKRGSLAGVIATASGSAKYDPAQLSSLFDKTKDNASIADAEGAALSWKLDTKNLEEQYVVFGKVTVEYVSQENFVNKIQTDIKIKIPDLDMESIGTLPSFTEYAVIADTKLVADHAAVSINGNVFAGTKGMTAQGDTAKLSILGQKVITKETILAMDGGLIQLNPLTKDGKTDALEVWAKNIETNASSYHTEYAPIIEASGSLYVADDTTLNAKNSTVTYEGSYYGYGYQETPAGSSAMMINRKNCKLDLSKISNLFVAGRAYIEPADGSVSQNKNSVRTGESISIKGNQMAYRLPAAAIAAATNPMPVSEYQKMIDSSSKKVVDLSYVLPFGSKPLSYYVDENEPYRTIFDTSGTSTYVYLYPNFASAGKANEYMQEYFKNGTDEATNALLERMQQYEAQLLLPDNMDAREGRKTFSGNLIGYQTEGDGEFTLYDNSVDAVLPQQFVTESDELTGMYYAYCKKLLPVVTEEEEAYDTVFDALLLWESQEREHPGFLELLQGRKERLLTDEEYGASYLVDNEGQGVFTIDSSVDEDTHLILATGDVHVARDFTGLIISKGTVTFDNGVTLNADTSAIFDLISHTEVKQIFRDYNSFGSYLTTKEDKPLEFGALISYENWKKE